MTIPSRPAPPPPQQNIAPPSRYTPTTDWDFCAFDAGAGTDVSSHRTLNRNDQFCPQQQQQNRAKKPPPPRPPPPKFPAVPTTHLKKPVQPQSINILSSLFGQKRASGGASPSVCKLSVGSSTLPKSSSCFVSGKLLPPPAQVLSTKVTSKSQYHPNVGTVTHLNNTSSGNYGALALTPSTTAVGTGELISFDSPPSSPTFTQKSCSDCISVDSFSSDSNYSSPNNGHMSQAESGFEDDFVASHRVGSSVNWLEPTLDPFDTVSTMSSRRTPSATPPVTNMPSPLSSSAAQIRTPLVNSKLQQSDFIDPLCNGRSVLPKVATVQMPTIIKPPGGSGSQKCTPFQSTQPLSGIHSNSAMETFASRLNAASAIDCISAGTDDDNVTSEVDAFESSPPMPNIPPPPAPTFGTYSEEPYGIALYDFVGETMEDLSFRANEKIYLLRRLNEEWYMGRDRRGLQGMFPVNYIDVKVPLSLTPTEQQQQHNDSVDRSFANCAAASTGTCKVRTIYQFAAETTEDLTIKEHDLVTVLYQITPEWLYGEIDGRKGQFPASYIEYMPPNLPQMPSTSLGSS